MVETTRRTAEADRAKQVALIEAAQEAEMQAVHVTTRARAEREAAELQAAAIVELAEATRQKGLAEAEAQRALNDAVNALSSDQTSLKFRLALPQALPGIIQHSVEPIKAIDGIKIIQGDGLNRGGAASEAAGPAAGGAVTCRAGDVGRIVVPGACAVDRFAVAGGGDRWAFAAGPGAEAGGGAGGAPCLPGAACPARNASRRRVDRGGAGRQGARRRGRARPPRVGA